MVVLRTGVGDRVHSDADIGRVLGCDVDQVSQLEHGVVQSDDGVFRLPDAPIPGMDDRPIHALNGLIGAMQRLGSARISALTDEVNRRLPRSYQVNDQYVRSWLTRHPELFTPSDQDRFKLASLEVDVLCGLTTAWLPAGSGSAGSAVRKMGNPSIERLRERTAVEIAAFLRREGPQPIGKIRTHLYGRFLGASADVVIAQRPRRFERQPGGLIALCETEEQGADAPMDLAARLPEPAGRVRSPQQRQVGSR